MENFEKTNKAKEKLDPFTEFETKYESSIEILPIFKKIARSLPELSNYLYTEGPDVYFKNPHFKAIGRYRVTTYPVENPQFAQWTLKTKPEGAKNNIKRGEPNWRVDGTKAEEIHKGAEDMGFIPDFKIFKCCHIYTFKDATIVWYSTEKDGANKEDYFIEIEVDEGTISELTENEAWAVIEKYEKILAPTGITPQKRLKKSLYERYTENPI